MSERERALNRLRRMLRGKPVLQAGTAECAKAASPTEGLNLFERHGAQFGIKPPVDVEVRLAAMAYQGAGESGVHATQLSVTASMLNAGMPREVVVDQVLAATMAIAPAGWDRRRERRDLEGMVASFDAKLAAEGRPNGPAHGNGADPDLDLSARHKAKAAAQASTWPLPEFIGDLAQAILPPREWLYGRHYVREFMSVTVGLSGAGKSNLAIAEVAAMASHRNLVGDLAEEPLRIWYHNGEDPLDELKRRFLAAMRHYEVGGAEVADRLIITSGRDIKLLVAEPGLRSHHLARGEDVIDWIKRTIAAREIDVMIVDPLVSTHQVDENSNVHMNAVAEIFAEVARDCRCAIDLVQHSRKAIGEEITIDHARGASALIAASRSARVLNTMSREEADGFGVSERRRFFRVENGKSSMYVPADEAEWFEIRSHKLDNGPGGSEGDSVGVVTEWEPPGPFRDIVQHDIDKALWSVAKGQEDGSLWRLASNAADWVGLPIAEALGIHTQTAEGRHRLARIVETWIDEKLLRVVLKPDKYRHMREFVDAASVR